MVRMGPEALRTLMARMKPEDIGLAATANGNADPIMARFQLKILTAIHSLKTELQSEDEVNLIRRFLGSSKYRDVRSLQTLETAIASEHLDHWILNKADDRHHFDHCKPILQLSKTVYLERVHRH